MSAYIIFNFFFVTGYKMYLSMPRSCYKLHTTARSWMDAFKVCAAEQATLITINSAEEAKLSANIFMEYTRANSQLCYLNKDSFMVGLSSLVIANEYRTTSGE